MWSTAACMSPTVPTFEHGRQLRLLSGLAGERVFKHSVVGPRRCNLKRTIHASATTSGSTLVEEEVYMERFNGYRRQGDYTPFELIEYTDKAMQHEVVMPVAAGIEKCYSIWSDRLNWLQWFDMIEEVGFHEDDPSLVSAFYMYRWARTPYLEFYTTFKRTEAEPNRCILEEPVEGTPLVIAVLFQTVEEARAQASASGTVSNVLEGKEGGTVVTLRISYQLAVVLDEFAGQLAVYADVEEKLKACMVRMAAFIENVDEAALAECRGQDQTLITDGFPEQRARRGEVEAERQAAIAAHEARVESALEYVTQEGQVMQDEATAASEVAAEKAVVAQQAAQAEAAAAAAAAPVEVKKAPTKRGRKPKKKDGN
ncbi:hypothetical protein ACKKBG_A16130 [Auxenochlorella protothecoides x Auxenochlorella symbiontica]